MHSALKEQTTRFTQWDHGFALFGASDFNLNQPQVSALTRLRNHCRINLPADPYCKTANRFREHARFVALPWERKLSRRPVDTYSQASAFNPTAPSEIRKFPPLSLGSEELGLIFTIVWSDIERTIFAQADQGVDVGIHLVSCTCTTATPGIASPNRLHKDGEATTFIHLLERVNVVGGESLLTDNNGELLFTGTLENCLDSLGTEDQLLFHGVGPIRPKNPSKPGRRSVLLVDFTPLCPVHTHT